MPSKGVITLKAVNDELKTSGTVSLNSSNVRGLAKKPSGEIKFSDFYGKSNKPVPPKVTDSDFGCVKLESEKGTHINFNGEDKVSGSWWYYTGVYTLSASACAFYPATSTTSKSDYSDGLNIKILGRINEVEADGDERLYMRNRNNVVADSHHKSTKWKISGSKFYVNGSTSSRYLVYMDPGYTPINLPANNASRGCIYKSYTSDGFDADENRIGGYLSGNTYTWFEATGHYKSAIVQLLLDHKNYRLGSIIHSNPGFK